jgi:hypothetical protein
LKKGGLAYRFKAELISDFDGHLGASPRKELSAQIADLEEQLKELSEKELEEQVYKQFNYLLCSNCRDQLDKILRPEEFN